MPTKISKISDEKEVEPWLQQILKQEVEHLKTNERFKVFAPVAGSSRMQCMICKPIKDVKIQVGCQSNWVGHVYGKLHTLLLNDYNIIQQTFEVNQNQADMESWIINHPLNYELENIITEKQCKSFTLNQESNCTMIQCMICPPPCKLQINSDLQKVWNQHKNGKLHTSVMKKFKILEQSDQNQEVIPPTQERQSDVGQQEIVVKLEKTDFNSSTETFGKPGVEISIEQSPENQHNQTPPSPVSNQEIQNESSRQEIDVKSEKMDLTSPTPELNPLPIITGDLFLLCHGKPNLKIVSFDCALIEVKTCVRSVYSVRASFLAFNSKAEIGTFVFI